MRITITLMMLKLGVLAATTSSNASVCISPIYDLETRLLDPTTPRSTAYQDYFSPKLFNFGSRAVYMLAEVKSIIPTTTDSLQLELDVKSSSDPTFRQGGRSSWTAGYRSTKLSGDGECGGLDPVYKKLKIGESYIFALWSFAEDEPAYRLSPEIYPSANNLERYQKHLNLAKGTPAEAKKRYSWAKTHKNADPLRTLYVMRNFVSPEGNYNTRYVRQHALIASAFARLKLYDLAIQISEDIRFHPIGAYNAGCYAALKGDHKAARDYLVQSTSDYRLNRTDLKEIPLSLSLRFLGVAKTDPDLSGLRRNKKSFDSLLGRMFQQLKCNIDFSEGYRSHSILLSDSQRLLGCYRRSSGQTRFYIQDLNFVKNGARYRAVIDSKEVLAIENARVMVLPKSGDDQRLLFRESSDLYHYVVCSTSKCKNHKIGTAQARTLISEGKQWVKPIN